MWIVSSTLTTVPTTDIEVWLQLAAPHKHIYFEFRSKREGLYTEWGPSGFDVASHPLMLMVSACMHGDLYNYVAACLTGVSVCRLSTSGLKCSTILLSAPS